MKYLYVTLLISYLIFDLVLSPLSWLTLISLATALESRINGQFQEKTPAAAAPEGGVWLFSFNCVCVYSTIGELITSN